MKPHLVPVSRLLTLALRHRPRALGIKVDAHGWAALDDVVRRAQAKHGFTAELIRELLQDDPEKRFALSPDGTRIRATYGHSLKVDLPLEPRVPPEVLFHGTARSRLPSILKQGLVPGRRRYVHLSQDEAAAVAIGWRRGLPTVLRIRSGQMHRDGIAIFEARPGLWLTRRVAPDFIDATPDVVPTPGHAQPDPRVQFGWLFDEVLGILDRVDPWFVSGAGECPGEYAPETGPLLRRLGSCTSADEVARVLEGILVSMFCDPDRMFEHEPGEEQKRRLEIAAHRIWAAWVRWNESPAPQGADPVPASGPPDAWVVMM